MPRPPHRGPRYRCEHGRERSRCKECGGSAICEHGRERRRCKQCGTGSATRQPRSPRKAPEPAQAAVDAGMAEADGLAAGAKVEDGADAPPLTGMAEVRAALRALGFAQYADAFEELGFDDLTYLRRVALAADGWARIGEIAALAGMKKGHAMRLASYLAGRWAPGAASSSGSI